MGLMIVCLLFCFEDYVLYVLFDSIGNGEDDKPKVFYQMFEKWLCMALDALAFQAKQHPIMTLNQ